jgi:hypothetical protein
VNVVPNIGDSGQHGKISREQVVDEKMKVWGTCKHASQARLLVGSVHNLTQVSLHRFENTGSQAVGCIDEQCFAAGVGDLFVQMKRHRLDSIHKVAILSIVGPFGVGSQHWQGIYIHDDASDLAKNYDKRRIKQKQIISFDEGCGEKKKKMMSHPLAKKF